MNPNITLEQIEEEMRAELEKAGSDLDKKMIRAEYKYRIKKLVEEGQEAYQLAFLAPYDMEDDCGCGES